MPCPKCPKTKIPDVVPEIHPDGKLFSAYTSGSYFKNEIYLQVMIKFSRSRFYLVFFKLNSGHFCTFIELWYYPFGGDRFIAWKFIKEMGGEIPEGIFDSSWNKIVNTGYHRAQNSYKIQVEAGRKNIDLLSCKAADLTEESLVGRNYTPPGNYSITEWVQLVNSGFLLGQRFFLNDMRKQQEANDAQITLSLSAGEQEDTVSTDQEFAVQLDQKINPPQTHSSQHKKVTPQKKNSCKSSRFKTAGVKPRFESRGVEL